MHLHHTGGDIFSGRLRRAVMVTWWTIQMVKGQFASLSNSAQQIFDFLRILIFETHNINKDYPYHLLCVIIRPHQDNVSCQQGSCRNLSSGQTMQQQH